MRHRIVRGRLVELEESLASDVSRWRLQDPLAPLTVVTGGPELALYLRRQITRTLGRLTGVRLVTLAELARELAEPVLVAEGRRPVPPLGERYVLEGIAARAGGYFTPVAGTSGLIQALDKLFDELRYEGIDARALVDAAERIEPERVNRDKLLELAGLYRRYANRLRPYVGPVDCLERADVERLTSSHLVLYGVWELATQERVLLERIARRVPLVVYLPSQDEDADRAHQALRNWLTELGAEEQWLAAGDRPTTNLQLLQHQRSAARLAEADGTVRLLSAPDPQCEVREAARACLEWAAQGLAFNEMAIVYRQSEPYLELVDEIFRQASIPIWRHQADVMARQSLGRSILTLLRLVGSRLKRTDVMEFLAEAHLSGRIADRFGVVEPAAWDALSREAGIIEGREQWLERLRLLADLKRRTALGDEDPDERLQAQLDEIDRLAEFIKEFADRLAAQAERARWRDHLDFLAGLLGDYLDGADPVMTQLQQLDRLAALNDDVPFERFRRVVRQALYQIELRPGHDASALGYQGVAVLNVETLRHLRFRAVIVLGLAERAFPPPRRQDPLLLDDERRALNEAFGWTLPLRAAGPDPEPLQFAVTLHAAGERLLLSYARSDAGSNRPGLPSHFFRGVAEALTGERIPVDRIDRLPRALYVRVPAGRFATSEPAMALTAIEFDRSVLGEQPDLGFACLTRAHPSLDRARRAWRARNEELELGEWDGLLGQNLGSEIEWRSGLRGAISASRLETYAACPFRFFLRHLLKLSPVEDPTLLERMNALDRGSLVHEILQRFLQLVGQDDAPSAARRDDHWALLAAVAEESFAERESRGLVGFSLLWRSDRQAILDDLRIWYDREAEDNSTHGLRPGAFEVRFGPNWTVDDGSPHSTDRPYELRLDGLLLQFQGRLDRIDWRPSAPGYRVIDYKTGASKWYQPERLKAGRQLQLPIYLLAAAQLLADAFDQPWDWTHGEAEYVFVSRRGEFKRIGVSGAWLAERWDEFSDLLRGLSSCIAAGDFHPEPRGGNTDNCRSCDFTDVCDSRIAWMAARKAGSRSGVYLRLAEVE